MKNILVTGATGTVGRQVVSQLLGAYCRLHAMTRNPERANLPPEVEIVRGDLSDPDSLEQCLDGVDAVFLVWMAPLTAADAAVRQIARHAQRVVLLTAPHKTPHPFFQQPNPLRLLFAEIERLIEKSGIEWTFLRPGMFAANALTWWAPQIRAGDIVRWPYPTAPTAPIHEHDIAAVAARALLDSGHNRAEYVLTGPESLSQMEQLRTIGEVIGRSLQYDEISPDEALRELPFPATAITMLLDAWAAAIGQPALVTSTVADVTGNAPRSFREWVSDHTKEFKLDFEDPIRS